MQNFLKIASPSQAPVAHTYNLSYLGDQDPEDGLKTAQAKSSQDLISTNSLAQWCKPASPSYMDG
jgi:hypothetical protein